MHDTLKMFWRWSLCLNERERSVKDAAEKLQMSMRTTAKCRYNAAVRLQHQSKYAFFTTTFLSLGLVFIPLIQNAGVSLAFKPNVLNMMQIFLGVAVLVYSVVIGTARYEVRSTQLTECGDKLKELIRELDKEREKFADGKIATEVLAEFQTRYSDIVTDVENHNRNDYRFATLEMVRDYFITGIPRIKLYIEANLVRAFGFVLPSILIAIELVFIADMMGATAIFTKYLNGNAAVAEAGAINSTGKIK
jgi:hypothetical protein